MTKKIFSMGIRDIAIFRMFRKIGRFSNLYKNKVGLKFRKNHWKQKYSCIIFIMMPDGDMGCQNCHFGRFWQLSCPISPSDIITKIIQKYICFPWFFFLSLLWLSYDKFENRPHFFKHCYIGGHFESPHISISPSGTVPRSVAFLTGIGVHRVSAKTKLQDLWIYLDFDKLWLKTGTVL